MKTLVFFMVLLVCGGCSSRSIVEPKTGLQYKSTAFLISQKPFSVTITDPQTGLKVDVKSEGRDTSPVADKIIAFGQALK